MKLADQCAGDGCRIRENCLHFAAPPAEHPKFIRWITPEPEPCRRYIPTWESVQPRQLELEL